MSEHQTEERDMSHMKGSTRWILRTLVVAAFFAVGSLFGILSDSDSDEGVPGDSYRPVLIIGDHSWEGMCADFRAVVYGSVYTGYAVVGDTLANIPDLPWPPSDMRSDVRAVFVSDTTEARSHRLPMSCGLGCLADSAIVMTKDHGIYAARTQTGRWNQIAYQLPVLCQRLNPLW